MNKLFENWNRYLKEDEQQSLPMDTPPRGITHPYSSYKAFLKEAGYDLIKHFENGNKDKIKVIFYEWFVPDAPLDEKAAQMMDEEIEREVEDFYHYIENGKTTYDEGMKFLFERLLEAHNELEGLNPY